MSPDWGAVRRTAASGMVYDRRGSGRPVALIHGWALSGRLWMYEQERLGDGCDVITPDLPGLGRSDGMAGPYGVARHADAVRELLAEVDATGAVLVGFAYGAAVALEVARAEPSRISGLVLVGLPCSGQLPDDRMLRSMRRDWPGYARRSAEALCRDHGEPTVRWLESIFVGNRLEVALETWQDVSHFDPLPLVSQVALPALFVHGASDDFSPVRVAEECAEAAPDGRLAVAHDARHLVPIDEPEWFHLTLQAFLEDLP